MRIFKIHKIWLVLPAVLVLWAVFAVSGFAQSEDAVWPETPGTVVESNGKLVIDASHADEGYVMACIDEPSNHAMKVRVAFGGAQLMYDINSTGEYEAFPLQLGSGKYEFALFENVKGSKYSAEGKVDLAVQLVDENAAFLVPNQYVNYNIETPAVLKSDELCDNSSQPHDYAAVTDFIADEFSYDFVRAKSITAGTLPEIDGCFENRAGICQDLAAVTVCMLRVQGIPARLVIGYADKYYHSWITAVVDGEEIFLDPTASIGAMNAKKYTVERYY